MSSKIQWQRLLALFAAAALLFNFPLQQLWQGRAWAVFVVWAVVIGLLAWLMERADPADGGSEGHGAPDPAAPPADPGRF
jgi:D-alanyl-lipoteichoic acid acyltransferase DltB (MBOAT superfamily)